MSGGDRQSLRKSASLERRGMTQLERTLATPQKSLAVKEQTQAHEQQLDQFAGASLPAYMQPELQRGALANDQLHAFKPMPPELLRLYAIQLTTTSAPAVIVTGETAASETEPSLDIDILNPDSTDTPSVFTDESVDTSNADLSRPAPSTIDEDVILLDEISISADDEATTAEDDVEQASEIPAEVDANLTQAEVAEPLILDATATDAVLTQIVEKPTLDANQLVTPELEEIEADLETDTETTADESVDDEAAETEPVSDADQPEIPTDDLAGTELNSGGEVEADAAVVESPLDATEEGEPSATPADLLAQSEETTDTAASSSPPTTAGVRGSMAAIRSDVRGRTQAIPTPEITAGTEASRRAEVVRTAAEGSEETRVEAVTSSAEAALPELPQDMPASILSQDNPVPGIQQQLAVVSNLTLENQTPPTLIRTPGGNLPELGRRPVSPDTLRELMEMDSDTAPVGEDEVRQRDGLEAMRTQLMTVPEIREGEGEMQSLVDIPPPAHPEISEHNRTQISQALARLLANPAAEAQRMVDRARGSAFVNQVLTNLETTSSLGNDTLSTGFAEILGVQFDAIREEAGITAEEMDTEVANYRTSLEEARLAQEEELQMSIDDGSAAVAETNARVDGAITGARTAMDEHCEEVEASMGGENQRAAIERRRDRLIGDINRHLGQQDANYRRAGETRARELDAAETSQIAAYRYAVQQDEFQLNHNRAQITDEQLASIRIPADVTEREAKVAYYIQVKVAESTTWLTTSLREVRASFLELKNTARITTTTRRADVTSTGETAREQVRTWADQAIGEEQSWWERLWSMVTGWLGQAEASAEAWETAQNQETVVAASGYVDMLAQVQQAAAAGITAEEMLARSNLTAEERAIIQAYFNPPDGGTPGDPIAAVAFGIRERVYQQRAGELKGRFESMVLDGNCGVSGEAYVSLLNSVGRAYRGDFDAWNKANNLYAAFHPGLTGLGTEEEAVFTELANLNPVQAKAVREAYRHLHGESLDSALAGEMDTDGERNRARGLLEGNPAMSDAAALHMAMDETFLGTGLGTERDLIMNTLRNKSPEEVEAIISAYESTYGGKLREHLREELNDWATLSTHDADMADAYMDSNTELADAIGMDQAMHGFTWGYAFNLAYGTNFEEGGRDEFTAVTDRIRQEVSAEATRNSWTDAQFQAEMRRRLARVEAAYDSRYGYGQEGALRAAVSERFDEGPNRDLVVATLENDEVRADAARIAAERYNSVIYASDEVITEAIERRYTRALEAERRDSGPALRREMNTMLEREDQDFFREHGRYMTGEERYARQQELEVSMERNLETGARVRSERDTRRMDDVFAEEYGNAHNETLTQAVESATSGDGERHALTALSQGGYLTRYQRFEFAAGGYMDGTNETAMLAAVQGATPEELEVMDREWRRTHNGESLRDRALSELSGAQAMDMTVALEGRPMTLERALEIERLRVSLEQPTSMLGGLVAAPERHVLDIHLREMEADAARLRRPVLTDADRRARDRTLGDFAANQQAMQDAVQIHRARVSAVTDAVANMASMVVAVAVGALVSFVTAGAATPLAIALIASVASTMTSIGTRMLLMGGQYGHEELLNDVILGIVDAAVAAATAGLGNRLLGVSQIGRGVAGPVRGVLQNVQRRLGNVLGRLGDIGPLTRRIPASRMLSRMAAPGSPWYSRLAANVMSESVENAVGAFPTAVVGAVIDDNNWRHGFQFGNAFQSVASQVGMGVGMGLGMSGGMHVMGRIGAGYRFLRRGPDLGMNLHASSIEHLPGTDAEINAAREAYLSQPHPDGTPRTEADFDAALSRERQRHLDRFLAEDPARTPEDFDAMMARDADARRAEHAEMNRGRQDADFDAEAGREAGRVLGEVDAEARQRQSYIDQLNEGAPEGRQADFNDIPISILSAADFARATGNLSGDAHIVMRNGQAHLVVRKGASPDAVRAQATRLAEMTAAGTGGRSIHAADALPSDLRGRVNVEVDESLPPRTVEVHYESHNGVIVGVWVQVGPGARAVDIQMHANVVRSMRRLQGVSGQVRQLLNRMRRWAGMNAAPLAGTRAFEARLEMEKLPAIINERAAALRAATTPEEQMRLFLEVENLRQQMETHSRFVDAIEAEPGVGYVAARDLNAREIANNLAKITDPETHAAISRMTPAEQAQFLYQTELINTIAGAHADPHARAAAVTQLIDVWRSLRDDFHAADETLVNRIMRRIGDADEPGSVVAHLEALMTLPGIRAADYEAAIRDLGYNQSKTRLQDQTQAIRNLTESGMSGELVGRMLVASHGIQDRAAFLNSVHQLSQRINDPTILSSLAERMNGSSSRAAMSAADRTDFIRGVNEMALRSQSLAREFPGQPHIALLTNQLIQGAIDVHRPGNFLGSPPNFVGEASNLIATLKRYSRSQDAVAAQALNARANAILTDPTMAPHLVGFTPPVLAATASGSPRSSADVIANIHQAMAHHELGNVLALVNHLSLRGIGDPSGAGAHLRAFMADVTTMIRTMDPARLRDMPALLPLYHQLVDRIRDFDRVVNRTHTILPGGRRISDEDYQILRDGSPTQKIRNTVNNGLTPPFDDPALPDLEVNGTSHADHVVSLDTIMRMDDVELLTLAQQRQLSNLTDPTRTITFVNQAGVTMTLTIHGNFIALSEAANTSKGAKSFANWTRYEAGGVDVDPEFRAAMMRAEAEIAAEIQRRIDAMVALNRGGTPLP